MFCGCGGSSQGAEAAGANLKLGLNHWDKALETHNYNFPHADHDLCDVALADPRRYPPTDILIASPECTSHTLSKGKKVKCRGQMSLFDGKPDPSEERSRATMWDVLRFTEIHRYRFVVVENVVDVNYWESFEKWLYEFIKLGYKTKQLYLNSQFFGVPQSRDRFYLVAWRQGDQAPNLEYQPLAPCSQCGADVAARQAWRQGKTWGRYGERNQYVYVCPNGHGPVHPYTVPAAAAIDWSLPSTRISDRTKPLSQNTLKRIAKGLEMFCQEQTQSFMVTLRNNAFGHPLQQPMMTICASGQHHGLAQPFLTSYYSHSAPSSVLFQALPTITTVDRSALVQPFLMNYYTPRFSLQPISQPLPTLATQPRSYLAQPPNLTVEDCYFRMLQPNEYHWGMGFSPEYQVLGNKREKVRQYGNAVTPPKMKWLIEKIQEVA